MTHLYGELFNLATGVKLAHVPYKGSGQAQVDLMAGHIKLLFTPAALVLGPIKAGKLIALASIGRELTQKTRNRHRQTHRIQHNR